MPTATVSAKQHTSSIRPRTIHSSKKQEFLKRLEENKDKWIAERIAERRAAEERLLLVNDSR